MKKPKRFNPKKGVSYRYFLWDEYVGTEQAAKVWHVGKDGCAVIDGDLPLDEARRVCAWMECPFA